VDEFELHVAIHAESTRPRYRYTPDYANTSERLKADLARVKRIVKLRDEEVGVDSAPLFEQVWPRIESERKVEETSGDSSVEAVELWQVKKELDLRLAYLRRVHLLCYYCCLSGECTEDMDRKCPGFHKRKPLSIEDTLENLSSGSSSGGFWAKRLDEKLELIDKPPEDVDLYELGGSTVVNIWKHIHQQDAERWGCNVCPKQFLGAEFVLKHIYKKHQIGSDDTLHRQYFNNYLLDPQRPMPATQPAYVQSYAGDAPYAPQGMVQPRYPFGPVPVIPSAPAGTPLDQIPRLGFGDAPPPFDPRAAAAVADPRKVRSYIDLDAPVEGDVPLNYG
jgi:hypothetical protein